MVSPNDSASQVGSDVLDSNAIRSACKRLINERAQSLHHIEYLKKQSEEVEAEWKSQIKDERKRLRALETKLKPYFETFDSKVLKDASTGNAVVLQVNESVVFPSTKKLQQRVDDDASLAQFRAMFKSLLNATQKNRTVTKLGDEL